jgi:hypothetical protein
MWIDYFNGCARACSLGIAAQIKIMGEPPLVFIGLWFGIYLGLPSEKYKIVSWKKKEFEDLEDLLVSFRLYRYKRQSLGMPPRHAFFIGKNQVTFQDTIFLLLHALYVFLGASLL